MTLRAGLGMLLVLTLGAAGVAAQTPGQPVTLAFATLDSGSAWYIYGATMAELLRRALPPGSNIDVKPRAGGVGNPLLVAKNETPLGLGFTVTNRYSPRPSVMAPSALPRLPSSLRALGAITSGWTRAS